MRTPVTLIIFNRPDFTERVLAQIAQAKPEKLFVVADGPRPDKPGDLEKCDAARAVIDKVDWDCEVHKEYSDVNLGCGQRPATGISRAFEQVDRSVILEDDVIPHPSFFRFCDELLERYCEDERVMQVCGHNYQLGQKRGPYSYYFSRYNICAGGWATWRRAWKHFDFRMKLWPVLKETSFLKDLLEDGELIAKWTRTLDTAFSGQPTSSDAVTTDYWDYQWNFAIWSQSGMSICPNTALVSNIGYREDGTHTKAPNRWANLPVGEMEFPLEHPPYVVRNREADYYFIELARQRAKTAKARQGIVTSHVSRVLSGVRNRLPSLR